MSEVVLDIGVTADHAHNHVDSVVLEPWQVRELLSVISSYRLKANTTSYGYLDDLHDALSEAL